MKIEIRKKEENDRLQSIESTLSILVISVILCLSHLNNIEGNEKTSIALTVLAVLYSILHLVTSIKITRTNVEEESN